MRVWLCQIGNGYPLSSIFTRSTGLTVSSFFNENSSTENSSAKEIQDTMSHSWLGEQFCDNVAPVYSNNLNMAYAYYPRIMELSTECPKDENILKYLNEQENIQDLEKQTQTYLKGMEVEICSWKLSTTKKFFLDTDIFSYAVKYRKQFEMLGLDTLNKIEEFLNKQINNDFNFSFSDVQVNLSNIANFLENLGIIQDICAKSGQRPVDFYEGLFFYKSKILASREILMALRDNEITDTRVINALLIGQDGLQVANDDDGQETSKNIVAFFDQKGVELKPIMAELINSEEYEYTFSDGKQLDKAELLEFVIKNEIIYGYNLTEQLEYISATIENCKPPEDMPVGAPAPVLFNNFEEFLTKTEMEKEIRLKFEIKDKLDDGTITDTFYKDNELKNTELKNFFEEMKITNVMHQRSLLSTIEDKIIEKLEIDDINSDRVKLTIMAVTANLTQKTANDFFHASSENNAFNELEKIINNVCAKDNISDTVKRFAQITGNNQTLTEFNENKRLIEELKNIEEPKQTQMRVVLLKKERELIDKMAKDITECLAKGNFARAIKLHELLVMMGKQASSKENQSYFQNVIMRSAVELNQYVAKNPNAIYELNEKQKRYLYDRIIPLAVVYELKNNISPDILSKLSKINIPETNLTIGVDIDHVVKIISESASVIQRIIQERNIAEHKTELLAEKRKLEKLADLNLSETVRNLIADILGIDAEYLSPQKLREILDAFNQVSPAPRPEFAPR